VALLAVAGLAFITLASAATQTASDTSLQELVTRHISWGVGAAALFLLAVSWWAGWKPTFLLVSLAFGSVHVFNAIITGELAASGVQALTAFMSGVAYLAIRIRTRSIVPIMLIHGLWDFGVFLSGSGADPGAAAQQLWRSRSPGWPCAAMAGSSPWDWSRCCRWRICCDWVAPGGADRARAAGSVQQHHEEECLAAVAQGGR